MGDALKEWLRNLSDHHDMPVMEIIHFIFENAASSGGDMEDTLLLVGLDCTEIHRRELADLLTYKKAPTACIAFMESP